VTEPTPGGDPPRQRPSIDWLDWLDPVRLKRWVSSPVLNGYPASVLVAGMFHARLSYKKEPEIRSALHPYWVSDLYSPGAGAQAYLALHARRKLAVIAFRGSEGREFWRDWIRTDMRAGVLWKWTDRMRAPGGRDVYYYPREDCLPEGVRCGWGFQRPINKLWPMIMRAAELQAKGWKLLFFGHSMGADLAYLAAARLIYTESIYPDLVIGYEPAKLWNRAGQDWVWGMVNAIECPLECYVFMNSSRGHLDLVTDMPAWAKHGGELLVAGENRIYTGKNAVAKYNQGKPPYRHKLPGWRPVSRLIVRLWRRGRGRVGAHLGHNVEEKLEQLYLRGLD